MKTYRIYATMYSYLHYDIEAESEEDAWKIAEELDGGLFIEDDGDWETNHVVELQEA